MKTIVQRVRSVALICRSSIPYVKEWATLLEPIRGDATPSRLEVNGR